MINNNKGIQIIKVIKNTIRTLMVHSLTKEKDQTKKEPGKDKIIKITVITSNIQYLIDTHHHRHQSIIRKALDSIQIFFVHHPKGRQLDLCHRY